MCRRLLLLLSVVLVAVALNSTEEDAKTRAKRHYYGGYDYGGYGDDYWYAGRIFGIIAGSLLFLLCCCTPCICLAGIWFMGWFGLRAKRDRKNVERVSKSSVQEQRAPPLPPPPSAYSSASRQPREVIIDTAPPPRSREPRNNDHIIYEAEDRFYSSSAPVTDSRPYRTSNF